MNAHAKRLAALVCAVLLSPALSSAVSLYSGLKGQAPVAAPVAIVPAAAVATPGAVLSTDLTKGPVAATAAADAVLPAASQGLTPEAISLAANPAATPVENEALAPLAAAGAALAPGAPQGSDGSGQALDELFIGKAKSLFYPGLQPGEEPAVASALPVLPEGVPSDEDARRRMSLSPLTNPEREETVKKLFIEAGAKPEEIQTQNAGRNRHNIFVVKKGRTDRVVVVGGHHDKVSEGAGTIDNWTGATMVINLYQAMRDQDTEATFVFIAFAREEEGLLGSQHYVNTLPREQLSKIDAMVNLDTLAVDGTFSWKNNSTRSMLDLFKKTAAAEKLGLDEIHLNGGDSDSSTFRRAGIAAMTLFGASPEVIFDIIHSARDTMAAFSLSHYMNAYKLTLAVLKALGGKPAAAPAAAPAGA